MKSKIFAIILCLLVFFNMQALASTDTSNWFKYEIPDANKIDGTALDASYLLDAPAGKHGFLTHTENDNFVFEDNTNVRFWGICLSDEDTIPDYEDSVLLAKRYSQLGYNLVRFISMENEIFAGRKIDGGREIHEENMDKLCFFLNELKKRGIYYIFDLNAGYWYTADDNITDVENVSANFVTYGYFDDNMIRLQKQSMARLFGYYNPYTGMKLADDPAMVFMNLRNENSIITAISTDFTSSYYNEELKEKFNNYLKDKYKTDENIKIAWTHKYPYNTNQATILGETERLSELSVELPAMDIRRNDNQNTGIIYAKLRQEEMNKFLTDLQMNYFKNMTDYLRNDVGIHCLVSGCTGYDKQTLTLPNFYSNNDMDLTETHLYNGHIDGSKYILYVHPTTGVKTISTGMKELPASVLGKNDNTAGHSKTPSENGYFYIGHTMTKNVAGKPHVISEWNFCSLDPYKSEGLLLMSAYASMHNTNSIMFDWGLNTISSYSDENMFLNEQFSTYNQPNFLSSLPAASSIFLRRDAKEADKGFIYERYKGSEPFAREFLRDAPSEYDNLDFLKSLRGLSHQSSLIGKTGMAFDDYAPYDDLKNSNDIIYLTKKFNEEGKYISITGDMSYDTNQRIYQLNTKRSQAVSGFISNKSIELDDVIFNINNEFATVYLTAVGNDDINKSERLLLTTVGQQLNTDQLMDETGQHFVDGKAGTGPILIEPITGNITLKSKDDISVYQLDNSGQRIKKLAVTDLTNGNKSFALANTAMNYEIVKNSISGTQNKHIELGDLTVKNLFTDVSGNDKQIAERAYLLELMGSGADESKFEPDCAETREEFISAIIKALNVYIYSSAVSYTDVPKTNKYFKQIAIANRLGLLSVYPQTALNPTASISKNEMIYMLGNAVLASNRGAPLTDKYSIKEYSLSELENMLLSEGYIDNSVAKNGFVSRIETARIIYNIMWK